MNNGVTDPKTGKSYTCFVRTVKARGFAKCNTCEMLKTLARESKSTRKRQIYLRRLEQHYAQGTADREELARIARYLLAVFVLSCLLTGITKYLFCRLCRIDNSNFGMFIDAVDKQKFGIPTTSSQAKCLAHMPHIKQKLTGVSTFHDDKLYLFRTLPDVKTGANLTLSIIAHMFPMVRERRASDLYINCDGASDNMCYTVVYGLAHLLHCANKSGWKLKRIQLMRFMVGHTHNGLDGKFGVLSRNVYGKNGTTARDLLSFTAFDDVSTHTHALHTHPVCIHILTYIPTYSDLPRGVRRTVWGYY